MTAPIEKQSVLEAAAWLVQNMVDEDVAAAVGARLVRGGHRNIAEWAKKNPAGVIAARDALKELVDDVQGLEQNPVIDAMREARTHARAR